MAMTKNPLPLNYGAVRVDHLRWVRIVLAAIAFLLAAFCVYGFIASLEPGEEIFRIIYPVIAAVCIVSGIWLLRKRR